MPSQKAHNWTLPLIMKQLEELGNERTKTMWMRHGAKEPLFGVPIADLKKIQKQVRKDHKLALDLFDTGNADACYLAGLIADESQMTKRDLQKWAREANWSMISTCSVAWVAGESPHAISVATKWIDAKKELVAATGWSTLSSTVSVTPDEAIDMEFFDHLLDRVVDEIHTERNEVKESMNLFVIAVGTYVAPLKAKALKAARKIGKVEVDHGKTACKTPLAEEYIRKVEKMGRIGKKRKTARC